MTFTLNGSPVQLEARPEETLLSVLRTRLGMLGTKEGCQKGECGCCTVILNGKIVNSCITPAAKAAGGELLTIEGMAKGEIPHPIQQAFMEVGAVQCGYCTPGMVLSAKALLDKNPSPTRAEAAGALSGNICRCTGYKKILDAVLLAAEKMAGDEDGKT